MRGFQWQAVDSNPWRVQNHLVQGALTVQGHSLRTWKPVVGLLHRSSDKSFSIIGTAVGSTASSFYGFNHAMPVVRRWIKGPMWLQFLIGTPPVLVFSSACAGLAGGAVPALAQLAFSSCHAAMSSASLPPSHNDDIQKSRSSSLF